MSRVDWDVTAAWMTRESIVSLPSSAAGSARAASPFDQLLERAQRSVGATSDYRPEAPPASTPPRPSESPPREESSRQSSQQPPRDDQPESARTDSTDSDTRPTPPTERHSESSSSQEDGGADATRDADDARSDQGEDLHDPAKAPESAAESAAAAASGAQAAQQGSHEASTHARTAKAGELAEAVQGHGKATNSRAGSKKQPRDTETAKADAGSEKDHRAKSQVAVQAATKDAAEAATAGQASPDKGDGAGQGSAPHTHDPGQPVAAAPVDPAAKALGADASAAKTTGADAAVQPIAAGAPGESSGTKATADAEPLTNGAARRGGPRVARASAEAQQVATEAGGAATAAEDASPAAAAPTASDAVDAALSKTSKDAAAPAGNRSAEAPQDAKGGDPTSVRDASAKTSDASAPQNDETARSDAAERARFVQRVTRAFESAADRAGHVRLRLHPPELGAMRLDLTVRDGHMSARLQTETEAARNMLLDNLPALKERLAEHQIKVESFEIEWQGQSPGGFSQHTADQSRWQPPTTGYAARGTRGGPSASGTPTANDTARRISPNTSFDVVI